MLSLAIAIPKSCIFCNYNFYGYANEMFGVTSIQHHKRDKYIVKILREYKNIIIMRERVEYFTLANNILLIM